VLESTLQWVTLADMMCYFIPDQSILPSSSVFLCQTLIPLKLTLKNSMAFGGGGQILDFVWFLYVLAEMNAIL